MAFSIALINSSVIVPASFLTLTEWQFILSIILVWASSKSIFLYKTKRNIELDEAQTKIIESIDCHSVNIRNEAGTITDELINAIEEAIYSNKTTKIIVDGEEDLATLPAIKLSKNGAKVIYGMPDKGMVVVDVNQQTKERANRLLETMLVK